VLDRRPSDLEVIDSFPLVTLLADIPWPAESGPRHSLRV